MRSILILLALPLLTRAAEPSAVETFLKKEIIGPRTALTEVQEFVDAKVPRLPTIKTAKEWDEVSQRIRERVLHEVVFRGEAAKWRDAKTKVETLETVKGTEGYTLKKVRYEILPGFWIPALLYEPEKLSGKMPVSLAVNGHDGKGKAADYKQIRCINMAKRGIIVLNVEWLGMGQLAMPGNQHGVMNQLNLCGTSGLAPFYLSMSRGLDLLLAHPNADPKRVAVSGLSGGGWQTIFISSLDARVTLTNPVAGYSSFRTRIQHDKDLGDSEQTPCDLGTIADYAHLTAMMAPRPTLLTFNAKDNCCFEAGYALPPLKEGAAPFFKLFGAEKALRSHVNDVPGDHNFGKDNREALYKMLGDFFFDGDKSFKSEEIDCTKEIKKREELNLELPADNFTMNGLAKRLSVDLPRGAEPPLDAAKLDGWRNERLASLDRIVRYPELQASVGEVGKDTKNGVTIVYRKISLNKQFTLPAVDMVKGESKGTTIVLNDAGRAASAAKVEDLLNSGQRVVAVDVYYFGEAKPNPKDWLWSLMLDTVGQRPLGLQSAELAAIAGVAASENSNKPVTVCAIGPRAGVVALVAAALESKAIGALELTNPFGSLHQIIESNQTVNSMPELFCFGLLEEFDIRHIAALVAPRPISVKQGSDRAKHEFAQLKGWYKLLGKDFDPNK
jgi:hypothetical protein